MLFHVLNPEFPQSVNGSRRTNLWNFDSGLQAHGLDPVVEDLLPLLFPSIEAELGLSDGDLLVATEKAVHCLNSIVNRFRSIKPFPTPKIMTYLVGEILQRHTDAPSVDDIWLMLCVVEFSWSLL